MNTNLEDHFITSNMIAEKWNEEGYLKNGDKWKGENITLRFKRIIETIVNQCSYSGNREKIKLIFKSISKSGTGGEYVFFDLSQIAEHNKKREQATLSECLELIKKEPVFYGEYSNTGDTYDTMKRIFELWSKSEMGWFTRSELEEFGMCVTNLIAWNRGHKEIIRIAKKCSKIDLKAVDDMLEQSRLEIQDIDDMLERIPPEIEGIKNMLKQSQDEIRDVLEEYFLATRDYNFYIKRIFIEEECVKEVQYNLTKQWKDKWEYVMDMVSEMRGEEKENKAQYGEEMQQNESFKIEDLTRCVLIWWQYKALWETEENEGSGIQSGPIREIRKKCIDDFVCKVVNHDLRQQDKEDYHYILKKAFEELEDIKITVENICEEYEKKETDEGKNLKMECSQGKLIAVRKCIELLYERK